ncbi:MAG: methyltransferase domain-containing protein [Limisphaerales bacterium]
MFLSHRSRQAECFDEPGRPPADIARDYAQLGRINRLFRHADPFTRRLAPREVGESSWTRADVLEVGAGDGQLAVELMQWADRRGWKWEFTCLDLNATGIERNPIPRKLVGDATNLPFPDASFDLVIASQMTHHLTDDGVVAHLREGWRVARRRLIVSDLHRNPFLYGLVRTVTPWMGLAPHLIEDGLISVRRGFRVGELRGMGLRAGIPTPRVTVEFGCRIVLDAVKA